jgi:hypothetical protein
MNRAFQELPTVCARLVRVSALNSARAVSLALVSVAVLLVIAPAGFADGPRPDVSQGIAAYERGDFAAALAILKPIVYDVSPIRTSWSDPLATAYLAQIYRRGAGTAPDWPLSCALFNNVWGYMQASGPGNSGDAIPFVAEGIKEVCLPELAAEVNALRSSCFLDGLKRQEFVLERGLQVILDRRGFHLDFAGEHRDIPLSMRCHEVLVSMKESDVSVPDPSSDRRVHFLELFKWTSSINAADGQIVRDL